MLSFDTQENYRDHVNLTEWYGREAGTCRIAGFGVEYDTENSIPFGRATVRIKYNPWERDADGNIIGGGWDLFQLDASYAQIVAGALMPIYIPEGSGIVATDPVKLKGDGLPQMGW